MPIGIAYGVWTACGVALVAVIARYVFRDPLTLKMLAGIGLIVAGVLSSNWRAPSTEHARRRRDGEPGDGHDEQPDPKARRVGDHADDRWRADEAEPHQPRQRRQAGARPQPGQPVGAVHGRGNGRSPAPRPAAAKPAMVPGTVGKASANPMPGRGEQSAAAGHGTLAEAVDHPVARASAR